MLLGQLASSFLRTHSSPLPFDIANVLAIATALRDKTAHWSLCLEQRAGPGLLIARSTRRTEDMSQQRHGTVSARLHTIAPRTSHALLSTWLGWNGLAAMCKSHVLDQAIFVDTVMNREQLALLPIFEESCATRETWHHRHSPLVTPLTCLRHFMLLPGAIRRILWIERDGIESAHAASDTPDAGFHFIDPDGLSMNKHSLFPFPLYSPPHWRFWRLTDALDLDALNARAPGSAAHAQQVYDELQQSIVYESVLAPFTSTYRYLQTAAVDHVDRHPTHPGTAALRYDSQNDIWSVTYPDAVAIGSAHLFTISLARLFHQFAVPLPASLRLQTQLMDDRAYVDVRDLVHADNNFSIIGTALYRLYHLHRLLQVATLIDDRCMLHVVQQVIDAHVPLLTMMTEHFFYQDDILLAPWHSDSPNHPTRGFMQSDLRQASHPLSSNALNEYAGVSLAPVPLIDVGAVPRVFFVWPSDSRYRVTLEESVSLSSSLNGLGYFVRKQEARTATQDWSDPALALKSLLTKYFPLRNFKRADKRIALNCFDAHPGLAVAVLNLLHVSQLGSVPGVEHRTCFVNRLRHWSFHYTSPLVASRGIHFIDHACFQQWRTFHRASMHELIGFYMTNCLPHLATTIFAHPRQGILYLKWITGVRYIMNVARRRYSQMPFAASSEATYRAYLAHSDQTGVYGATLDALQVLMLSQEIMIQRESDVMTKKLNIFMHHATETEAMARWFWTLLDQLANRVLTTLRFLHRSRAPWSPDSVPTTPLGTASRGAREGDGEVDHDHNDDDDDGDDEDDAEDSPRNTRHRAAALSAADQDTLRESLAQLSRVMDDDRNTQLADIYGAVPAEFRDGGGDDDDDADEDDDDDQTDVDFLAAPEFADAVNFDTDLFSAATGSLAASFDAQRVAGDVDDGDGLFSRLFGDQTAQRRAQLRNSRRPTDMGKPGAADAFATPGFDDPTDACGGGGGAEIDAAEHRDAFEHLLEALDRVTRADEVSAVYASADSTRGDGSTAIDDASPADEGWVDAERAAASNTAAQRRGIVEAYLKRQRAHAEKEASALLRKAASSAGESASAASASRGRSALGTQKVITAHGLEAWSLTDEQMSAVMQQFVRSLSYVPSLDNPGQEALHETFRKFCYMAQRHSKPSSQERIPLLALGYFGLSRKGLDFVHRLRVYDRHGLPPNRLEIMVRLFWLKFPTDFALIARYLKYVQLYSMDQMLLLPRDIAELQYTSRVQVSHGNALCYRIRREQLREKIARGDASAFERAAYDKMAEALHVTCFCISCRNWTEPLAPSVMTTYTEQTKTPLELRRYKQHRVAIGIQSEGRQTKNPIMAPKRSAASNACTDTAGSTAYQQRGTARVRLSHIPNIDPRRTVADFVAGVVRCLSDARARSSIGFSALLTELAYGRGISTGLEELQRVNPPLYLQKQWYTAERMLKWMTYARLVHLFPIRPEQLDALMKQVSEIYPQLANRINKDGFVATSVTAACPSDLVSTYISEHGGAIDMDNLNELEREFEDDAADPDAPRTERRAPSVNRTDADEEEDADDDDDEGATAASARTTTARAAASGANSRRSAARASAAPSERATPRTKVKRLKTGMSYTVDPEVQRFLPEYHFDSRVRFGQTNGMVHDDVLRDVSDVIRDGLASIRALKGTGTRSICGAVAERVNLIGKIFFAPPHTHSINLYTPYVCCSLCPMVMRAQENQFSDTPGVGYVCAKHSGMLRPIDPNNCDLDQFNAGGGGSYFPRIASLDPRACSQGTATELVASHQYFAMQPTHLLGLPPQWWCVHASLGSAALALHMTGRARVDAPARCDRCAPTQSMYSHTIAVAVASKTTGRVAVQNMCENCHRRYVSRFQTRAPRRKRSHATATRHGTTTCPSAADAAAVAGSESLDEQRQQQQDSDEGNNDDDEGDADYDDIDMDDALFDPQTAGAEAAFAGENIYD